MRFFTVAAGLLSVALAAPTTVEAEAANCAPSSYTISDFHINTSPGRSSVGFNFKSNYAGAYGIVDPVASGVLCAAAGDVIPNNNACNAPERKLLFDLRASPEKARYQITHTWVCNGQTWMSGNDVTVSGKGIKFAPQNVRKICNSPRC